MSRFYSAKSVFPEFNVEQYVKIAEEAAKRTRWLTVVLAIASVLISIGIWNSMHWSWATERVKTAFDKDESHIQKMFEVLGDKDHHDFSKSAFMSDLRFHVMRAYVDNVRFVNIPVFGIAIDINDLGLLGGLGLVVILLLLRFSVSREIKNLNILFRDAFRHEKLCDFYHTLAMKQVFTVPEMRGESRNMMLKMASKAVYIMPSAAILYAVTYDIYTSDTFTLFQFDNARELLFFEIAGLISVFYLSLRCLERQLHIDEIWADYWILVGSEKNKEELISEKDNKKIVEVIKNRIKGPLPRKICWWWWLFLYFCRWIDKMRNHYVFRGRLLLRYFRRRLGQSIRRPK